jgi:demethylmenaquinone methyltransferase/2-methoxy-6-polyprenyl-1,4-benzoquinol methylase
MKTEIYPERDSLASSKVNSHLLFDRISSRYDLLNRLLSLGRDIHWRKEVSHIIREAPHENVLDLACGTCDLIIEAFASNPDIQQGIGVDMAEKMLGIGKKKLDNRNLETKISLVRGDGMAMPVASNSIDFAMIAFGIRNMHDPLKSLSELFRVLKSGGRLVVLEFSIPVNRLVRVAYLFYFRYILPLVGGIISGDHHAYRYLNRTVEAFSHGKGFGQLMKKAGFASPQIRRMTFGIATIYCGDKQ